MNPVWIFPAEKLPSEITDALVNCAMAIGTYGRVYGDSWEPMKERQSRGLVDSSVAYAFEEFEELTKGFLSENVCYEIQRMLAFMASYESNKNKAWYDEECKFYDEAQVNLYHQQLRRKKEISANLADNIRDMGWQAVFYCNAPLAKGTTMIF